MAIPGTIQFPALSATPSAPPVGSYVLYIKTDNVIYLEDSNGNVYPFGSTAAITSLTGDVSATGPGVVPATVNFVGGESATNIANATIAYLAATSSNTPSTLVLRDSSGNFSAGTITANLTGNATTSTTSVTSTNFTGSLSGDVTGTQGATVVSLVDGYTAAQIGTSVALTETATSSNIASSLVQRDASGNFSANIITAALNGNATTATTSTNFTGSLSGDVTGTQSATVVSFVGGKTAADVASATATVDAATALNTASTLVFRDASGNFAASVITANVTGNVSGSSSSFTGSLSGDVTGTQSATSISSTTVTGKLLTGYAVGSNTPLVPSNSILTAFENLQAQINATTGAAITALTGDVTATGPGSVASTVAKIQGTTVSGTTGTTNVVFSANPTLTGTLTAAAATFSGALTSTDSSTTAVVLNTTSFIFDTVNNALGIGIQPATNVMIDGINTSGASKLVQMTGYGVGSTTGYRGRFARGTLGTPAAAQSGDVLSVISGRGYGASQFAAASTGILNIVAGETFTNTSNLTYLQFQTTPTGSVTAAESMRIASTGVTLGPQSTSTALHQINGGVQRTTRTVTAATLTVDTTTTDDIIYTDSTSNAITITLPTATNGRVLVIQDKTGQAATNHITVTPPGTVQINGVNASVLLGVNYGGWVFISDGTNWTSHRLAQLPTTQAITSTVIDWSTVGIAGGLFTKTLSANTTFTFSNATAGQTIVIRLTNTASNYTVTWPTIKWPVQTTPVMTTGAFSDVYTIIYDGTTFFGSYVQNF